MTDAEQKVRDFLGGLVGRTCELIERECAVEEAKDHIVVLVLLAAGNVVLSGLPQPKSFLATETMLPMLVELVHADMLRRQQEREKKMH